MTTRQIQDLLHYLGYNLTPDGVAGPETEAAILDFQQNYGFQGNDLDGIAGPVTQKALKDAVAYDKFKPTDKVQEKHQTGTFWDDIPYFSRGEFRCTCGGRYCNGFPVEPDEKMVRTVNAIRQRFGVPFGPNSAIRCTRRNAEVGGEVNSQHLYGTACDISVPGVSPSAVAAYAEELLPNSGGIGVYDWGIHVDSRATKARWKG